MRTPRIIGVTIIGLLLCLGVAFLVVSLKRPAPISVVIEYRGTTNSPPGIAWAHFRVVNRYSQPIVFRIGNPEVIRQPELDDSSPSFAQTEHTLAANGTTFIRVTPPSEEGPWRVPIEVRTSVPPKEDFLANGIRTLREIRVASGVAYSPVVGTE